MNIDLKIVERVVQGVASEQEILACGNWRAVSEENEQLFERIRDYYDEQTPLPELTEHDIECQWRRLEESELKSIPSIYDRRRRLIIRAVSAAAVLLISLFIVRLTTAPQSDVVVQVSEVVESEMAIKEVKQLIPDADEITFTTNNKTIKLDSVRVDQSLFPNAKVSIRDQSLAYEDGKENETIEFHTLAIPKKKNFSVTLADGTVVHLNANTKLTYPSSFKGAKERRVKLEGEAYFEVAHNKNLKFIVETGDVEVMVHGTKFNVNTYKPGITETVLVEGVVSVKNEQSDEVLLKPNQMANCSKGREIVVREVDVFNYLAWRDGIYAFYEQPLYSIVTSIAAWYGYDVKFETEAIAKSRFICNIPRYETIEEVMNVLMMSNSFKYTITNDVIIISAL